MAQRTTVTLIDDLDGSEAVDTVEFAYKGKTYTLDLNEENLAGFDEAMAPYLAGASEAGAVKAPRSRATSVPKPRASSNGGDVDPKSVRAWAEANGITVSPRGRLKADLVAKFKEAGN